MQDFEAALLSELAALPELAGRAYPLSAPELDAAGRQTPFAILVSSEGVRTRSFSGREASRSARCEIHVVCHADYAAFKQASRAVLAVLESLERRQIGVSGPFVQEVVFQQPIELYEADAGFFRSVFEFEVYY